MKYFVFKKDQPKGTPPVQIFEYEPTDFLIGELTVQYGPLEILPESQYQPPVDQEKKTQEYIKGILPHGAKIDWKK